jgi:hypothetical protein
MIAVQRADSPDVAEDISTVTSCSDEIRRLFSLDHITTDPYILFHMSPELWVPIKAVMMLESIVKITRSRKIIKLAIFSLGYEYDHFTHMFRPSLRVPRTDVVVRNATLEEVKGLLQGEYESHTEDDYLLLAFDTEEAALISTETMLSSGYMASIDSVDPYCHIQSKVLKIMPDMLKNSILNRLFFQGRGKEGSRGNTYSRDELLNIFLQMSPGLQRPTSLQLFSTFPVVSDKPNVTLENLKTGRVRRSSRPELLPRALRQYRQLNRT